MSYVIFDVETSGLNLRFDQILQFAAIRADSDLNPVERIELRSRLSDLVVPSPAALMVTGRSLEAVADPSHMSHYAMVKEIHATLARWTPAVFLGYNSIKFDEEFLRSAFYQTLHHPIFLTNIRNNCRADVLKLVRAAACLHPGLLAVPTNFEGQPVFALQPLAAANGIVARRGHDALSDVETTLALSKIIHENAPELWSRFMRFASKHAVRSFIDDEDAFGLFEARGNSRSVQLVTKIGAGGRDPNVFHCLDLLSDIEAMKRMSDVDLIRIQSDYESRPVRQLKINASPILCETWELDTAHLGGLDEDELVERARNVRDDADFVRRLLNAAAACERQFPPSPYVEQQIYDGFPSDSDVTLCEVFHRTPWEDRPAMIARFSDPRMKRLAMRVIYFERPDLLPEARRLALSAEIENRVCGITVDSPWLTIPTALTELETLELALSAEDAVVLSGFKAQLLARLGRHQFARSQLSEGRTI